MKDLNVLHYVKYFKEIVQENQRHTVSAFLCCCVVMGDGVYGGVILSFLSVIYDAPTWLVTQFQWFAVRVYDFEISG